MVLYKSKSETDSLACGVISAYGSISDDPANHHRYQHCTLIRAHCHTVYIFTTSFTKIYSSIILYLCLDLSGELFVEVFQWFIVFVCEVSMSSLSLFGFITPTLLCLEHQLWGFLTCNFLHFVPPFWVPCIF
jgi:hypothetical protein